MDVIAEGLGFPEGPVVMADGSVIVVEVMAGRISRCWNGRTETICAIGGGPNGAAIGPDGALWICNNGGLSHDGPSSDGRIERVDLATGRFERVHETCDGKPLKAPNDLVFAEDGRLWFTDFGTLEADGKKFGGLYTAAPAGAVVEVARRAISYNGVGLSPDGAHVYVADTFQARLYRFDARPELQEPQYVATAAGPVGFDSLAVTAAGNICVATVFSGGITTVTPDGATRFLPVSGDDTVTNIAFGGEDMRDAYITLSMAGKLVRTRWEEPGLRLAFNA
jgi:gluconolactonase